MAKVILIIEEMAAKVQPIKGVSNVD